MKILRYAMAPTTNELWYTTDRAPTTQVLIEEARQRQRRRRRWIALVVLLAAVGGALFVSSGGGRRPPSTPVSRVEHFFDGQGARSWTTQPSYSGPAVGATIANYCMVKISSHTPSSPVSAVSVVCNPPDVISELIIPYNELGLVQRTVREFDPSEYSAVGRIRTAMGAGAIDTVGLHKRGTPVFTSPELSLQYSSDIDPVLNLTISDPAVRS